MEKKKVFLILAIALLLAGLALGTKFFFLDHQDNSISALRVDSSPKADLYINDKNVGKTPYSSEKMAPGEYKLKLVATGTSGTFYPWETKIKLTNNNLTYVSRDIGKSEDESGDQILWLEKISSEATAQLAIVSDPDRAKISVDGVEAGVTSTILKDITIGNHEIVISMDGFSDQIIKAKLIAGFRINAAIKLGRANASDQATTTLPIPSSSATLTATASAKTTTDTFAKPYVLIKETGTGFLRVRTDPKIGATESGKVKPGDKYSLLLEQNGWTKIQISTSSGWVNDQYIQKFK